MTVDTVVYGHVVLSWWIALAPFCVPFYQLRSIDSLPLTQGVGQEYFLTLWGQLQDSCSSQCQDEVFVYPSYRSLYTSVQGNQWSSSPMPCLLGKARPQSIAWTCRGYPSLHCLMSSQRRRLGLYNLLHDGNVDVEGNVSLLLCNCLFWQFVVFCSVLCRLLISVLFYFCGLLMVGLLLFLEVVDVFFVIIIADC